MLPSSSSRLHIIAPAPHHSTLGQPSCGNCSGGVQAHSHHIRQQHSHTREAQLSKSEMIQQPPTCTAGHGMLTAAHCIRTLVTPHRSASLHPKSCIPSTSHCVASATPQLLLDNTTLHICRSRPHSACHTSNIAGVIYHACTAHLHTTCNSFLALHAVYQRCSLESQGPRAIAGLLWGMKCVKQPQLHRKARFVVLVARHIPHICTKTPDRKGDLGAASRQHFGLNQAAEEPAHSTG